MLCRIISYFIAVTCIVKDHRNGKFHSCIRRCLETTTNKRDSTSSYNWVYTTHKETK